MKVLARSDESTKNFDLTWQSFIASFRWAVFVFWPATLLFLFSLTAVLYFQLQQTAVPAKKKQKKTLETNCTHPTPKGKQATSEHLAQLKTLIFLCCTHQFHRFGTFSFILFKIVSEFMRFFPCGFNLLQVLSMCLHSSMLPFCLEFLVIAFKEVILNILR